MNKIVIGLCFFGTALISSCSKGEVCDCVEIGLAMMKEEKAAGNDLQKLTDIHEKYRVDLERCEKLDEGRSEEEKKIMEEDMRNCDAFNEMEALSNEMLGQ